MINSSTLALALRFRRRDADAPVLAQDHCQAAPEVGDRLHREGRLGAPRNSWSPRPIRWRSRPATRSCSQGGAAIDAAIATQLVLTLVEPQSSGIGGGAFLVHYDGKQVQAFDGRETAPSSGRRTPVPERPTARRCRAPTAWSAAARSARRACCACSNWRTSSTASCPGRPCSRRRSACPSSGFAVSPRLHGCSLATTISCQGPGRGGLLLRRRPAKPGRSATC